MKSIADRLRDADPLRHEPRLSMEARERLRRAAVTAASDVPATFAESTRRRAIAAVLAVIVVAIAVTGWRVWPPGGATLQAAVRFEVRLAEVSPAPGLQAARIADSVRTIYLHPEIIVNNDDIARTQVVQSDGTSRFSIAVEFNAAGTQKMRQATAGHIGRPMAILIDGEVVAAPTVRSAIGGSAVISGDFSREAAERIVNGMAVQ